MEGIIFKRNQTNDGSLIIKTIQENGQLQSFKIPGVLKSSKRSAYFISPATIWNFTVTGNHKEILIPKEYSLVHSPIDFDTSYTELLMITEAMKPLGKVKPESGADMVYSATREMILKWEKGNKDLQSSLLNYYYLIFLHHMGLFHFSDTCINCGKSLGDSDKYHFYSGSLCIACLNIQTGFREQETLPNTWVLNQLNQKYTEPPNNVSDSEFRQRILKYIDSSL